MIFTCMIMYPFHWTKVLIEIMMKTKNRKKN